MGDASISVLPQRRVNCDDTDPRSL